MAVSDDTDHTMEGLPQDGRSARAMRTRDAIVDACIALVDEGDLKPTTSRIAERAGVSVRSVFQHFDGIEQLYAAVAERVVKRVIRLIVPVDAGLLLGERIAEYIRQRALLLEVIAPVRRAASVHGPFSQELTRRLRTGQQFFREFTAEVFAHELSSLDIDRRQELLDILEVIFGWPTWETLRTVNGRSVDDAVRTVDRMARGAFAETGFATGS